MDTLMKILSLNSTRLFKHIMFFCYLLIFSLLYSSQSYAQNTNIDNDNYDEPWSVTSKNEANNTDLTQSISARANRVVKQGEYLFVIDEPGVGTVTCPALPCKISIRLNIFKMEEGQYTLLSEALITDEESASYGLFINEDKLSIAYQVTIRRGTEQIYYLTKVKVFDISNKSTPTLISEHEQPGSLRGSMIINQQLTILSAQVLRQNHDGGDEDGDSDGDAVNTHASIFNKTLLSNNCIQQPDVPGKVYRFAFYLNTININSLEQEDLNCIAANFDNLNSISLHSSEKASYINVGDNDSNTIYSFLRDQDRLNFISASNLNGQFVLKNSDRHMQATDDKLRLILTTPSNDTLLQTYQLSEVDSGLNLINELVLNKQDTDSNAYSSHVKDILFEAKWITLAIANTANTTHVIRVNTQFTSSPWLHSVTEIKGMLQKLVTISPQLLGAFVITIDFNTGFEPTHVFTLLETPWLSDIKVADNKILGTGFLTTAIPVNDSQSFSSFNLNWHQSRITIPVSTVVYSPTSEIPVSIELDVVALDIVRNKECLPWISSCWSLKSNSSLLLDLPYEGDDPGRARTIMDNDGFHYILGNTPFYKQWTSKL